ncbi:MAG: metal ABC transporter permease [Planctomycetaceae bacterium]
MSDRLVDFLLLRDYTTRWALLGTVSLGIAAGVVGAFMLLRKRSLVGDVVSHAALPGVAIAFLVMEVRAAGGGRWLPGLLVGAAAAGFAGVLSATFIRRFTRLKEDATLAVVLGVFYGVGVSLFSIAERITSGMGAIEDFTLGAVHSIVAGDVALIAGAALLVLLTCGALFKEFTLLCFDPEFAATRGWPVGMLDVGLMGLVVAVAVIGLQSVGLLLMVAMLITPAAAARFWTDDIRRMALIAALLGGLGAFCGVFASHLVPKLSAGATIVLAGSSLFAVSLLFGTRRGVAWRMLEHRRLARRIAREHLLRACYEALEAERGGAFANKPAAFADHPLPIERIVELREWTRRQLERKLFAAEREELSRRDAQRRWMLTKAGAVAAAQAVRNHRLWELYLIHYADIAPSHVDRDADRIEHVLGPEIVAELERQLVEREPRLAAIPASPHEIEAAAADR